MLDTQSVTPEKKKRAPPPTRGRNWWDAESRWFIRMVCEIGGGAGERNGRLKNWLSGPETDKERREHANE